MSCRTDSARDLRSPAAQRSMLRIGDHDRADAADRLTSHAADGRLSTDELEGRLEAVHTAVTHADLAAVELDLPTVARRPRPIRAIPSFVVVLVITLVAVLGSLLAGHPVPPVFFAVFLVWHFARRRGHGPVHPIRAE